VYWCIGVLEDNVRIPGEKIRQINREAPLTDVHAHPNAQR